MIKLSVNGKAVSIDADADMPLLWALREQLQLTGTKFGCGMALCGACTVHLDGKPVRSCSTPMSAAAGKKVTTIEGHRQHPHRQGGAGRLDQPRCAAMRLLPVGPDHERLRAAGREEEAHRCGHRRRDERQPVPLRHLQPDPRGHQGRIGHPHQGSLTMDHFSFDVPRIGQPLAPRLSEDRRRGGAGRRLCAAWRRRPRAGGQSGVGLLTQRLPAHHARQPRHRGLRLGRNGPGRAHRHPDAAGRRTRRRLEQSQRRAGAGRQGLQQPDVRHAGHRRQHHGARALGAVAQGRRRRARDAGGRCRRAMEGRRRDRCAPRTAR